MATAAPQRRELPRQSAHAVVRTFAHQLRILVAAGIDSGAHLTRVLAQHRAHGGAHRPRSLNLKRVSPCHSSCTGRCTRFSNNQRARNGNWQSPCPPTLVDARTTQCRSARTTAGYIHCPTEPLQCAQPVRIAARPLGNSRAYNLAQLPEHRSEMSTQLQQELHHPGCTRRIAMARESCTTARSFFGD